MVKFFFSTEINGMNFGETLKKKRKEAKLSQEELAELAVVDGYKYTGAYISNIERGYDKNKKGEPTRPNKDLVIAMANVLNWDVNDALTSAGHAPLPGSPQYEAQTNNLMEGFKESVQASGIDDIEDKEAQGRLFNDLRRIAETMIQEELKRQEQKQRKTQS